MTFTKTRTARIEPESYLQSEETLSTTQTVRPWRGLVSSGGRVAHIRPKDSPWGSDIRGRAGVVVPSIMSAVPMDVFSD